MMQLRGSVMLMSIFHGKRFIEWRRWFATVKFPIIVLLCGMVNMADVCSSMFFTDNLKIHTLLSSDILYYYNMNTEAVNRYLSQRSW